MLVGAIFDQGQRNALDDVDRDGESHPELAGSHFWRADLEIDADYLAPLVEQRSPELPGLMAASVWMEAGMLKLAL